MNNRYLRDRAMKRAGGMDGRNPYGSKGGYVVLRKGGRGRDRAMGNQYGYPERDSRYYNGNGINNGMQDYHMGYEYPRESHRPMEYEMYGYGVGGIRPMEDYGNRIGNVPYPPIRDYGYAPGYNYNYDYASEDAEKEWKEDLKNWCEKLKKYDRFNLGKEEIINKAKQMGVTFDKYDELEFIVTYYMMISDYKSVSNDPHLYLALAKSFLEDEDTKLKGSEKLCAYYYEVVEGGEK